MEGSINASAVVEGSVVSSPCSWGLEEDAVEENPLSVSTSVVVKGDASVEGEPLVAVTGEVSSDCGGGDVCSASEVFTSTVLVMISEVIILSVAVFAISSRTDDCSVGTSVCGGEGPLVDSSVLVSVG